jgi:hypothetical protein
MDIKDYTTEELFDELKCRANEDKYGSLKFFEGYDDEIYFEYGYKVARLIIGEY